MALLMSMLGRAAWNIPGVPEGFGELGFGKLGKKRLLEMAVFFPCSTFKGFPGLPYMHLATLPYKNRSSYGLETGFKNRNHRIRILISHNGECKQ